MKPQLSSIVLKVSTAVLASVLFLAAVGADAAPKAGNTVKLAPPAALKASVAKPAEEKKPYALSLDISRGRKLNTNKDGSFEDSTDFEAAVALMWAEKWKTAFVLGYSRPDEKPETESDWADTAVVTSRAGWKISDSLNLGPSLTLVAPTSKSSREVKNMTGVVGTGLKLGFNPGVLKPGVSLGFAVSLNRLFHTYDTDAEGAVNTAYSSKQTISGGYEIGRFSFSAKFIHANSMSYQNTLGERYEHAEEIGFKINDNAGLAVGHTLSGAALKPNGIDSNYAFIDQNESKVYGTISVSY